MLVLISSEKKRENELYFNQSHERDCLVLQFQHQQNILGWLGPNNNFSCLVTFQVNIVIFDCKCLENQLNFFLSFKTILINDREKEDTPFGPQIYSVYEKIQCSASVSRDKNFWGSQWYCCFSLTFSLKVIYSSLISKNISLTHTREAQLFLIIIQND